MMIDKKKKDAPKKKDTKTLPVVADLDVMAARVEVLTGQVEGLRTQVETLQGRIDEFFGPLVA